MSNTLRKALSEEATVKNLEKVGPEIRDLNKLTTKEKEGPLIRKCQYTVDAVKFYFTKGTGNRKWR